MTEIHYQFITMALHYYGWLFPGTFFAIAKIAKIKKNLRHAMYSALTRERQFNRTLTIIQVEVIINSQLFKLLNFFWMKQKK